ncbi:MAG: flagellar protein FlaG [Cellulosilyticum sp.]|nr:flagellar protein FlaG [Cellulosilyticum sp.]
MEIGNNRIQDPMVSFTSVPKMPETEAKSEMKNQLKDKNSVEEERKIQNQDVINLFDKIHKEFEIKDNELSFSVHDKTKRIMVKVLDKETKEVIREIPSEKIVDMVASMMEVAGLIVDKRG